MLGLAMHLYQAGFDVQRIALGYLNVFFLFGLGNPGATSQVVGGWSLGIEFIFYLLFPLALSVLSGKAWPLLLIIAFTSQHVFVNLVLGNGKGLVANWNSYTQFLSFVFYFAAGCAIGRFILSGLLREHWVGIPILIALLGVLAVSSGNTSDETLIALPGIGLSIAAVLSVLAAACLKLGAASTQIADLLGKSSYGVYILHPLLLRPVDRLAVAIGLGSTGILVLTLASSFAAALLLERLLERPIQEHFKRGLATSSPL